MFPYVVRERCILRRRSSLSIKVILHKVDRISRSYFQCSFGNSIDTELDITEHNVFEMRDTNQEREFPL